MDKLQPNFTQIPNVVFDQWMSSLNGAEFKILCTIARQTFGWIEDEVTGRRKKTDWISYSQLSLKTGLTKTPISKALRKLEELGFIEIFNESGTLLRTQQERSGKKLYYAITARTSLKNRQVDANQSIKSSRESRVEKLDTQNKDITKETYTKDIIADKQRSPVKLFKRLPEEKQQALHRVVYHLEDTLHTSIVNWGKQAKALALMQKAGYTEAQIKKTITYMAREDDFFSEKGFDLMSVANNIPRYKAEAYQNGN